MWNKTQTCKGEACVLPAYLLTYLSHTSHIHCVQQCTHFPNRLRFDKVTESLKVGTFFETQCRCLQREPSMQRHFQWMVAASVERLAVSVMADCSVSRSWRDTGRPSRTEITFVSNLPAPPPAAAAAVVAVLLAIINLSVSSRSHYIHIGWCHTNDV